jgi:hypothetical protein
MWNTHETLEKLAEPIIDNWGIGKSADAARCERAPRELSRHAKKLPTR